jgi:hypothetical protein
MDGPPMDALRDGLARGLARYLAPARLPDGFAAAFAEAPRGAVFDLGANAAAAEALAHPMLGGAEGALDLLLALSAGGRAPRRLGPARLVVEDEAASDVRLSTPHHRFTADLRRGEIRQHLAGEDGPPALLHGGNLVEFTWRGRRHCLDVEDAIVAAGVEPVEGGAVLFHDSSIAARGRFSRGAAQEVARLRYAYAIRADSPAVRLSVTLTTLPGVTLERVRITAACDAMSPGGGVAYGTVMLGEGAGLRRIPSPDGENVTVQDGPVSAYGAEQDGAAARALRLLVRPCGPAPLLSLKASGPAERRLHWLLARYAAERLGPGESLSAVEERVLLRGLPAPLAAPRGATASTAAPAGAIALALATHALLDPGTRGPALREGASRALIAFDPAGAGPADLARALMAAEALHRATGEAALAARAATLAAALLATQHPPGVFRAPAAGSVGDHAGALLALARHQALAPGVAAAAAIRQGVAAIALVTLDGPVDTLALRGEGNGAALATADLAGLLRALRAVQAARAAGALAMPEEEARRLAFLATTATALLQARIRPEGEALVVAAGAPGSAPSLPAQAAALAAFLPPEGAVLRVAA